MRSKTRLEALEAFYAEVATLTVHHDSVPDPDSTDPDDRMAVVSPAKLAAALSKVDPDWFKS